MIFREIKNLRDAVTKVIIKQKNDDDRILALEAEVEELKTQIKNLIMAYDELADGLNMVNDKIDDVSEPLKKGNDLEEGFANMLAYEPVVK